jgi:hypothetical protein
MDGETMETMKTISIRQPWAWLIVNGYKDVENRTWAPKHRGRVLIHAGKTVKGDDFPAQREWIRASGIQIPEDLPTGAIVGEATITGTLTMPEWVASVGAGTLPSPWFEGPVGIQITDAVAYAEPIPAKGQLGIYDYPN